MNTCVPSLQEMNCAKTSWLKKTNFRVSEHIGRNELWSSITEEHLWFLTPDSFLAGWPLKKCPEFSYEQFDVHNPPLAPWVIHTDMLHLVFFSWTEREHSSLSFSVSSPWTATSWLELSGWDKTQGIFSTHLFLFIVGHLKNKSLSAYGNSFVFICFFPER